MKAAPQPSVTPPLSDHQPLLGIDYLLFLSSWSCRSRPGVCVCVCAHLCVSLFSPLRVTSGWVLTYTFMSLLKMGRFIRFTFDIECTEKDDKHKSFSQFCLSVHENQATGSDHSGCSTSQGVSSQRYSNSVPRENSEIFFVRRLCFKRHVKI